MADVYAVFGTLFALGIAYPGLLAAWQMLFPGFVGRTRQRIAGSAWASFGLGIGIGIPLILIIVFFISVPVPVMRFLGAFLALCALSLSSLGAAGLAGLMGSRLNEISGGRYSVPGAQMRGAIALELAGIFPFIGWLLVFPLGTLTCLGAGVHALFSRSGQEKPAGDLGMLKPTEA
jgi:hypothetical protein